MPFPKAGDYREVQRCLPRFFFVGIVRNRCPVFDSSQSIGEAGGIGHRLGQSRFAGASLSYQADIPYLVGGRSHFGQILLNYDGRKSKISSNKNYKPFSSVCQTFFHLAFFPMDGLISQMRMDNSLLPKTKFSTFIQGALQPDVLR
jgi:hypothetical protein